MPTPPLFEVDPGLIGRVCVLIETRFVSAPKAFALEGCSKNIWANYQKFAREEMEEGEPGPFSAVVDQVLAAMAEQAAKALSTIGEVMTGDSDSDRLKAAVLILEKNHREEYGKQQAVDMTVDAGSGIADMASKVLEGIYETKALIAKEEAGGDGSV